MSSYIICWCAVFVKCTLLMILGAPYKSRPWWWRWFLSILSVPVLFRLPFCHTTSSSICLVVWALKHFTSFLPTFADSIKRPTWMFEYILWGCNMARNWILPDWKQQENTCLTIYPLPAHTPLQLLCSVTESNFCEVFPLTVISLGLLILAPKSELDWQSLLEIWCKRLPTLEEPELPAGENEVSCKALSFVMVDFWIVGWLRSSMVVVVCVVVVVVVLVVVAVALVVC